jgi:mono/diheme cytochrome c family protein
MRASWITTIAVGMVWASLVGVGVTAQSPQRGNPEAAKLKNPVAVTAASIAAGEKTYMRYCQGCHAASGKGGIAGESAPPAPDLTDATWDRGSSDGEIYDVIENGVPPDMFMGPFGGQINSTDAWNLVNYLRSLGPQK